MHPAQRQRTAEAPAAASRDLPPTKPITPEVIRKDDTTRPVGRHEVSRSHFFGENSDFAAPHTGQVQSAGRSSKAVPGGMPVSGSPFAGS
jgi:hypothetical protein